MSTEITADDLDWSEPTPPETATPWEQARASVALDAEKIARSTPIQAPRIVTPTRVFKVGPLELIDPDPSLSPHAALRLYRTNYPYLANARLCEPRLDGERLIYEVEPPPVQTKGAPRVRCAEPERTTPKRAMAILQAWTHDKRAALPAERRADRTVATEPVWTDAQCEAIVHILRYPTGGNPAHTGLHPCLLPPP